jgi:NADPH:quinone reductase-like Zn-dependent oxidoreductase
VVFYGATQGNPKGLDLRRIFWKQLRLQGTTMGTAEDFSSMLKLFTDLKLRPVVDRTFPLAAANEAFAHVAAGAQYGKVVLVP